MANLKKLFLVTFLSVSILVPISINSMWQGVARTTYLSLRYDGYAKFFIRFANNMCAPALISQEKTIPLQNISSLTPYKDVAQDILHLTREFGLKTESISILINQQSSIDSSQVPTATTTTFNRHLLFLGKCLENKTNEEKKAVIEHELVHMKDNCMLKSLCIHLGIVLLLDITSSILCPEYKVNSNHSLLMNIGIAAIYDIIIRLIVSRTGRHFEKHADILAATEGHCAAGLIRFLEKNQETYQQSKRKGLIFKPFTAFAEFFDEHPSIKERIQYLTPIAKAQQ